jgi:hypothetical protein
MRLTGYLLACVAFQTHQAVLNFGHGSNILTTEEHIDIKNVFKSLTQLTGPSGENESFL